MADHDEIAAIADRVDDRVGVLGEAGGVVVAREIHRDDVMVAGLQLGGDQMPAPRDIAGAMDQDEGGHRRRSSRGRVGSEVSKQL